MFFFHSVPQFFQYRVILLFGLSSPMHMTEVIYNKSLFRHKTDSKNSKERGGPKHIFQCLFQQARQIVKLELSHSSRTNW